MPFPNKDTQFQSGEEAVENGKKGGIASGEARREKRDLRKALEALLERQYEDKKKNKMSGTEILAAELFKQASKGNVKAFEVLRDTVGQKPVEKVEMATIDQSVIDEVERMVFKDDDTETSD